jgi:6-pyruvoyltetrahydropterin/6-carboxytetrahydropterin synthase
MSNIRVTKEFNFEMAYALYGYDGPCKNIHGHSYVLSVTVIGLINDHALLLNGNSPHKQLAVQNDVFEKIILGNYWPTCENMIIEFVNRIKPRLPMNIRLHHLNLRETSTSFAEWYAEDNE